MKRIDRLQVIFKTVERCNIACKYCYYFYGGDESYKDRPAVTNATVVEDLASFLDSSLSSIDIKNIQIVFHGGEPLLQKKRSFDKACATFKDKLAGKVNLFLTVQTNGMLIDDEWIDLFNKHQVIVGVSLDGDEFYNDLNRIDHNGGGTYLKVVKGLRRLQKAYFDGLIPAAPSLITVINNEFNYKRIVDHFVNELDVTQLRVLLPDMCHDDPFPKGAKAEDYGQVLIELFDFAMKTPEVLFYPAYSALDYFQLKHISPKNFEDVMGNTQQVYSEGDYTNNQIIVIQSDGEISLDDSFIPAVKWRSQREKNYINRISLYDYLNLPVFEEIKDAYESLPKECEACSWKKVCRGGDLENRYKHGSDFNNPSVFCDGLQSYYAHIVRYLYSNGYPKELILEKLT